MASINIKSTVNTLLEEHILSFDMSTGFVFMANLIHPDGLPYLADYFNIDISNLSSYTEITQRRDAIKQAILLKKKSGTIYGIKQALLIAGYIDVEILDNPSTTGGSWIDFIVNITSSNAGLIGVDEIEKINKIINDNKRSISRLLSINIFDPVGVGDMEIGNNFIIQ